jgi:hypothetical protein
VCGGLRADLSGSKGHEDNSNDCSMCGDAFDKHAVNKQLDRGGWTSIMKKFSDLILSKVLAVACLAFWILPGSASASVVLDLSTLGPNPFASGTVFTDPAGLGWDMTVTSSGGFISVNNPLGLGVVGGVTPSLDSGETITFAFSSAAALEGFTLMNGANDFVTYTVFGTPDVPPTDPGQLPNAGSGGNNVFIGVTSLADTLTIDNSRLVPKAGDAYRISSLTFVPIPAAAWLFGSALGLLGWMRRKQAV